jgi:hypothetical protein
MGLLNLCLYYWNIAPIVDAQIVVVINNDVQLFTMKP